MRLRYDEDLVEEAVLLCTTGRCESVASLQIARFNRARERVYDILDPDERNTAFFRLHLEWFREWGLEKFLADILAEFPLLASTLEVLVFRKSRRKNEDGAELYVTEAGDRNGVVAFRPERFARKGELAAFLRHELAHLHDMLDPAFGYEPDLPVSGPFLNQQVLARERYRLLWNVSIDGRLNRKGRSTIATRTQRWSEFAEAFAFWPEARQLEVFESLWGSPDATHRRLVELLSDPRQIEAAYGPKPGAPCPLCGFPTFAWAQQESLTGKVLRAIQAEFPQWMAEQGACARCAAVYRSRNAAAVLT